MRAVHFGAGNIGRGFIGETLAANGFGIDFVDVNETIIDALVERGEYDIQLAAPGKKKIHISNVTGINNAKNPKKGSRSHQDNQHGYHGNWPQGIEDHCSSDRPSLKRESQGKSRTSGCHCL